MSKAQAIAQLLKDKEGKASWKEIYDAIEKKAYSGRSGKHRSYGRRAVAATLWCGYLTQGNKPFEKYYPAANASDSWEGVASHGSMVF